MAANNEIPVIDITCELEDASQPHISHSTEGIVLPPTTKLQIPRPIVDSYHLAQLVKAYSFHFEKYSHKRKKVSQLIPALVWKNVYMLYKNLFPNSRFAEETLKDRLRETLRELKTGNSNLDKAEKVVLQDNDVLTRLRSTKGHASHNIFQKRDHLMNGVDLNLDSSTEKLTTKSSPTQCFSPGTSTQDHPSSAEKVNLKDLGSTTIQIPKTKARSLREQAIGISSIAEVMKASQESRITLLRAKLDRLKLSNFKFLQDYGAIIDVEFKKKTKDIMRSMM